MNKFFTLFIALIFGAYGSKAQAIVEYTDYGNIHKDVNYDGMYGDKNLMDVYISNNTTPYSPLVIMIHGGAYSDGSKQDLRELAQELMKYNISAAVINYELLSKKFFNDNNEPDINDMLLNIWHAIQYLQIKSEDWNTPKNGYYILGEEAGGHLALLAGYKFKENIRKIIAIGAITDLKDMKSFSRLASSPSRNKLIFTKLMGNVAYRSEQYLPNEYVNASPIHQISNVPTLLIHGVKDVVIPYEQSAKMYQKLQEKAVNTRLVNIINGGHLLLRDPNHKYEAYDAILDWIDE